MRSVVGTKRSKRSGCLFDIGRVKDRLEELDNEMQSDGFWDDAERAGQLLKESKSLKNKLERFDRLKRDFEDLEVLIELGLE